MLRQTVTLSGFSEFFLFHDGPNLVYRNDDWFAKTLAPGSLEPNSIKNEVEALRLLGRAHKLVSDEVGIPWLLTPALGVVIAEFHELDIPVVHSTLQKLHSLEVANLPKPQLWLTAMLTRFWLRLELAGSLAQIKDAEELLGRDFTPHWGNLVVSHGDPHVGNWVRAADGTLNLIDWESMRLAPAEWDLAYAARGLKAPESLLELFPKLDDSVYELCGLIQRLTSEAFETWHAAGSPQPTYSRESIVVDN